MSMAGPVDRFREYLCTHGKRLTQEKSLIVEEVFASREHFDAQELVGRVTSREDINRVSRSTIYRALGEMEKAGLIQQVAHIKDRSVYEPIFLGEE